jgi:hypothetical protein
MTDPSFAGRYGEGLREFVEDRSERRLQIAYELGRAAVQSGLSVLDVAVAHTKALVSLAQQRRADVVEHVEAAGDFLVESLAAFEMVQRGATEARRAAFQERRRARMLRELSSVFADATVAHAAPESVGELAQLVSEITREVTGAASARLVLQTPWAAREVEATAEGPDVDTWSELLQPAEPSRPTSAQETTSEIIREPLGSPDGRFVGTLEISGAGVSFSQDDRAMVTQIAQMLAAWLDRAP